MHRNMCEGRMCVGNAASHVKIDDMYSNKPSLLLINLKLLIVNHVVLADKIALINHPNGKFAMQATAVFTTQLINEV